MDLVIVVSFGLDESVKFIYVVSLYVDRIRFSEVIYKVFVGFEIVYSIVVCFFNFVIVVLGNEMVIVNNVLFIGLEL